MVGAAFSSPAFAEASSGSRILGFTASHAAAQSELEAKFDAQLSAADQRAWLEQMSSAPNHVGAPHNRANAEFMLAKFIEWGFDAHLETFQVLFPTPKKLAVEMVAPTPFSAKLQEPPVPGDRTSTQTHGALPPFAAYGGDGDVTGELVYVNQGMPDDYLELARRGIEVRGRIVIARYGGGWRGLKPKLAYQHGAIGCLIYSDPHDDGYGAGDAYPKGAFRPAEGVQRGSVADMPVYPGDPLTPGVGATAEAKRLAVADARTVLKIPVVPISYGDAQPLLNALGGAVVPEHWRGALPLTYHFGPGPAKVHLTVACDWSLKPIYNVIAVMEGSERPDEWVIRGNHHDGWVFGAWDPLSANSALMAEAKAMGALAKDGWRPKRTLVFASWDGEEPGLLGSTEWAETHRDELRRKAVLYINADTNGRGFLRVNGSHPFQTMIGDVAHAVTDPQTKATVAARLRARLIVDATERGASEEDKRTARLVAGGGPAPIGALGSGSDYTAFLDHVGIATLDIRYGGEDESNGVYHSNYDSFDHYLRFGDPNLTYGVTLAQTIGRVMLRTANADVLPLHFTEFAETVSRYGEEMHKLADSMRDTTELAHRVLAENLLALAADPTDPRMALPAESDVPVLNLAPLDNALIRLRKSAKTCDALLGQLSGSDAELDTRRRTEINDLLRGMEQSLLSSSGLPGREWFQHMIYAPGLMTGYGVKTLPGVREAIEERRWSDAEKFAVTIGGVLNAYCDRLDKIAGLAGNHESQR